MLTRDDLQKHIISLILQLDRNALKRSFCWSKHKNSYSLEILFICREHIERVIINKDEMPYVYDYFYRLIFGINLHEKRNRKQENGSNPKD